MANTIQIKRSSVLGRIPDSGNLLVGEPAVNLEDQILYTKDNNGNVIIIGAGYLDGLENVSNTAPADNEVLTWDAGLGKWKPAVVSLTGAVESGYTVDTFTGDGSTSTFTLSRDPYSVNSLLVTIQGVKQRATTDYTVSGNVITFVEPPPNTDSIDIVHLGSGTSGVSSVNSLVGNVVLTSGNITESTNLYFTNTRARNAITTGNSIIYDTATGNITLATSGVTATTYGGATNIPVFNVNEYGLITSASNASISSTLNLSANTGSNILSLLNDTLNFAANGFGISTQVSLGNVLITNTGVTNLTGTANEVEVSASSGNITIGLPNDVTVGRNLTVLGNLTISGNLVTLGVENLLVEDSLIHLANNNTSSDALDIGFDGSYYDSSSSSQRFAGLFRDASDSGLFKLFNNVSTDPSTSTTIDTNPANGFTIATLVADILASNANVTTALNFGNEQNQILSLAPGVLEIRGGFGNVNGALQIAAGDYPTSYSKIALESAKKITAQADEIYFTLFNDGNTKLITMNTTHTAAISTTTGAIRISGGIGMTGNLYADNLNGTVDGGNY